MHTALVPHTGVPIVEGFDISRLDDALELISACYEHSAHAVLLESAALPEPFFVLATRFAGEFVQKLVNYRLRVGAVFPVGGAYSERFLEYVGEASDGPQFRTFATRDEALAWLSADGGS